MNLNPGAGEGKQNWMSEGGGATCNLDSGVGVGGNTENAGGGTLNFLKLCFSIRNLSVQSVISL
jgi:hypothetical protein